MLSEYLDRELTVESYEEIEAHLADCPPCIEFLHSLDRHGWIVQELRADGTAPPLAPEVRAKCSQRIRRISPGTDRNSG